ncbi:MAG: MerR family transcriptional regulator [Acidimicrobiales bacterium]
MTSGINERPYLSIGEVLALLLEEFPDVTISKIRFLESQGLIEPERTASGYRKFFDADIERLKLILREQKENFLPLRVIRDRLDNGTIDDSGSLAIPTHLPSQDTTGPMATPVASAVSQPSNVSQLHRGIRNVRVGDPTKQGALVLDDTGPMGAPHPDDTDGIVLDDPTGTISPHAHLVDTARHPAARRHVPGSIQDGDGDHTTSLRLVAAVGPSDVFDRSELCQLAGITQTQLQELESYGLVTGRGTGSSTTFTESDLAIVKAAAGFLQRGIDARHLKGWRQSADREAGLFEQRILPLLRQRNPQARQEAVTLLGELADLGAELRAALVVSMLRHHLDS